MIVDNNLQLSPGWQTHVQTDGSNIGGTPPSKYGMVQGVPGNPTATLFFAEGCTVAGGYADWLAGLLTPLLPNTGNLQLTFDLTPDARSLTDAQAIEIDTIICANGWNYNCSMQLDYSRGGVLQVSNAQEGWVDTPFKPGKLG